MTAQKATGLRRYRAAMNATVRSYGDGFTTT
jgi:hypothetical protein